MPRTLALAFHHDLPFIPLRYTYLTLSFSPRNLPPLFTSPDVMSTILENICNSSTVI
jgi:hypothetical protein